MRRVDRFRQTGAQHSAEKADKDYQNSREHGASHWQYIRISVPKKKPPPPERRGGFKPFQDEGGLQNDRRSSHG